MAEEIKNEKDLTFKRLNKHLKKAKIIDFDPRQDRAIIFSDHHMGNGGKADRFKDDEEIYKAALKKYNDEQFHLILGGDVLEGFGHWGVRHIVGRYRGVFELEKKFLERNAYHRIYGNHDRLKRYYWKNFGKLLGIRNELGKTYYPSIKLGDRIVVSHGHQGDLHGDQIKYIARVFVKLTYAIFGHVPKQGPAFTCAAADEKVRDRRDRYLSAWAETKKCLLVAGHTHDAVFKSKVVNLPLETPPGETRETRGTRGTQNGVEPLPNYFNSGSAGVYNNGITGIEIESGQIRLVWWKREPMERKVIREDKLENIFRAIDEGGIS